MPPYRCIHSQSPLYIHITDIIIPTIRTVYTFYRRLTRRIPRSSLLQKKIRNNQDFWNASQLSDHNCESSTLLFDYSFKIKNPTLSLHNTLLPSRTSSKLLCTTHDESEQNSLLSVFIYYQQLCSELRMFFPPLNRRTQPCVCDFPVSPLCTVSHRAIYASF